MNLPNKDTPIWLQKNVLLAVHANTIIMHGGTPGVRDPGLVDSALAKPLNLYNYSRDTTLAQLAASYADGIIRNHPFIDGNKRTGFIAAYTFLHSNNMVFAAKESHVATMTNALAGKEITEHDYANWIGQNTHCDEA